MGYMNGVVDFSGPAIDYAGIAEARAANKTIKDLYKALRLKDQAIANQEITINNYADAYARMDVGFLAVRDATRSYWKNGELTEGMDQELDRRLEEYHGYVKEYGYEAFKEKVNEALEKERQIEEDGGNSRIVTVLP